MLFNGVELLNALKSKFPPPNPKLKSWLIDWLFDGC
jgi:hypothetical protein